MKEIMNELGKKYVSPSLELVELTVDVITASGGDDDEGKWDPRKKARIW